MRRALTLLLLAAANASANDPVASAADAVLAGGRAADATRLAELAARGEHDAAEAFARAAPRKDVERLPDYITARRGKRPDAKARMALAAATSPGIASFGPVPPQALSLRRNHGIQREAA